LGFGTIFQISSAGNYVGIYSFLGFYGNGGSPTTPLVQAHDGSYYGQAGGVNFKFDFAPVVAQSHLYVH